MEPKQIAIVCHEANRAYCMTLGDNSQPAWDDAPEWQRSSALKGVQFHMDALRLGKEPSPAASHESSRTGRQRWKKGQESLDQESAA